MCKNFLNFFARLNFRLKRNLTREITKLDLELKTYNQKINGRRIGIVHVFGSVKALKILAARYRNKGKRLGLRFNLIAGIYNLELSKKPLMKER